MLITSFCGHLPHYLWRMASIVSQMVVVLVNRDLSDGPVTGLMSVDVTVKISIDVNSNAFGVVCWQLSRLSQG